MSFFSGLNKSDSISRLKCINGFWENSAIVCYVKNLKCLNCNSSFLFGFVSAINLKDHTITVTVICKNHDASINLEFDAYSINLIKPDDYSHLYYSPDYADIYCSSYENESLDIIEEFKNAISEGPIPIDQNNLSNFLMSSQITNNNFVNSLVKA